jgi:hypothetical protein
VDPKLPSNSPSSFEIEDDPAISSHSPPPLRRSGLELGAGLGCTAAAASSLPPPWRGLSQAGNWNWGRDQDHGAELREGSY